MDKNYRGIAYKFGRKVHLDTLQCKQQKVEIYIMNGMIVLRLLSDDMLSKNFDAPTRFLIL